MKPGANESNNYGQWGDFFGGILNPILTFLTFMGLLVTIILQQRELRETREELKRSAAALEVQNENNERHKFEDVFFHMLAFHDKIVNYIHIGGVSGKSVVGRDCFAELWWEFRQGFRSDVKSTLGINALMELADIQPDGHIKLIRGAYEKFWTRYDGKLGHYYRFLYNVIRFVDESQFKTKTHIRLLRAQISDAELLLLYYNCLGMHGEKFRILAEKYSLFDNMDTRELLSISHMKLMSDCAFGGISDAAPQ